MGGKKIKIGFLPFYIKLYDDIGTGARARGRLGTFYETLAAGFEELGFEVVRSEFCRVAPEFSAAVGHFEREGADCIVTWHAAYSPSLECVGALTRTDLPVVVLDTTETYDFGATQDPGEISYCHGIHGVMDMCSLLLRQGKQYAIAAGHYSESDVFQRTAGFVRAAVAARALRGSRVGSLGGSFEGMGDFLVSDEELKSHFGVTVVYPEEGELASILGSISDEETAREVELDRTNCYEIEPVDPAAHIRTAKNCLAVRRWTQKHGLSAFTANFRTITETGLTTMPFMEACKAMARGIGYAGEGDVLTAALLGALLRGFPESSFVEIFCPDWRGNTLLLSHMGEYNPNLICQRAGMKEMNFIFGKGENPVVSYGCYRGGEAVFINLHRTAEGFRLLVSSVEMLDVSGDNFESRVRGWMRPHMPIAGFLETLSRAGATHHSALVYGARPEQIGFFASLCGLSCEII